jgi:hypothetical protein
MNNFSTFYSNPRRVIMKSKVMLSAAGVVAAFLLAACAGKNPAPTEVPLPINEKVSITVDLKSGNVVERGYEWVDNAGIVHVQGRVIDGQTVSGDLTGKFKITIANSERDPRTGNSKETLIVECAATWTVQKRSGVFSGELKQQITDGSRAASNLAAKGKDGFDRLTLEVTFKEGQASAGVLVGDGRIVER